MYNACLSDTNAQIGAINTVQFTHMRTRIQVSISLGYRTYLRQSQFRPFSIMKLSKFEQFVGDDFGHNLAPIRVQMKVEIISLIIWSYFCDTVSMGEHMTSKNMSDHRLSMRNYYPIDVYIQLNCVLIVYRFTTLIVQKKLKSI